MLSKSEILQKHFGSDKWRVTSRLQTADIFSTDVPPTSSFTKMELPYIAPNHPELPTFDQIEQAMKHNRLSQRHACFIVCRVGDCVIKLSNDAIILQEAEDLLFLREHTQVRTPKLYAVLSQTEEFTRPYFMVTEYLEGNTLIYENWKGYSEDAKTKICSSISEQLSLLRSIPSEGYYGRVHKQGWRPDLRMLRTRSRGLNGPYNTYEDFVSALYDSAELTAATCHFEPDLDDAQNKCLASIKTILMADKGRQPTFTHLDPKLENIIVRRVKRADREDDDWEATFIDWADSGWYPAWMQSVAFQALIMVDKNFETVIEEQNKLKDMVLQNLEDRYQEHRELFEEMDEELTSTLM